MGCAGVFWAALGVSWGVLSCHGVTWAVLGCPGCVLGCPGLSWTALGMPCVSSVSLWAPLACFPIKVVMLMSSVRDIMASEELGRGQARGQQLP